MLPCDYYFAFNNDISDVVKEFVKMKDFISYNDYNIQVGRSEDLLGDSYWYVICPDLDENITCCNFFKKFEDMISFLRCYYLESEV